METTNNTKFIPFSTDESKNKNAETWLELSDGTKVFIPRNYRIHLDLKRRIYTLDDNVKDIPTISELVKSGVAVGYKFPFDELSYRNREHHKNEVTCHSKRLVNRVDLGAIQRFFTSNGYNVSMEALEHNFNAWKNDRRSGFRDENNGYHLFTPCGCNDLAFHLSTIHTSASDWQQTYD